MKKKSMEKFVVILGKNFSTTLGAVRALGEQDYKIDVHFVSSNIHHIAIVKKSRYIRKLFQYNRSETGEISKKLISLYAHREEKTLIIATDDLTAAIVDLHYNELSPFFLMPHAGDEQGGIVRLMNKSVQLELADSFGLKTAKSWVVEVNEKEFQIPEEICFPCFFKPLNSYEGGKQGMKKCDTKNTLLQELSKLQHNSKGLSILVQEYLSIDNEFSISGYCCKDYVYLPALLRKLQVSQAHKGTTVSGVIDNFDTASDTYLKLVRMLASFDLYSIFDIEIFRCGNQIYFNEINFRTSAVCYGIVAGGANTLDMYLQTLAGGVPMAHQLNISYNKVFLCEKAAWDDYIAGIISKNELKKLYEQTDYFIIRNDRDPKPERAFLRVMEWMKHRQRLKRLLMKMKLVN